MARERDARPMTDWYDPDVVGTDTGMLVMAENLRTDFVRARFMRNANVRRAPIPGSAPSDESATGRANTCHSGGMSDPRNVAHDKKVTQEKKHNASANEVPARQPGKKTALAIQKADPASASASLAEAHDDDARTSVPGATAPPAELEGSLVVLAQLKDLDFHSRAHLERLAALQMTIEDELNQPDVAEPLAELYAAQSTFQTRLTTLLDLYKSKCDRLQSASA